MHATTTFIYCLVDPRDDQPKYIGKANDLNRRLSEHILDKRVTKKTNWIKSLKSKGLRPSIELIDEVFRKEWKFWEKHYISLYRSWGFNLKNHTDGGEGVEEIIAMKIAKALCGKKQSQKTKDKRLKSRKEYQKETGMWAKSGTYEKAKQTRLKNDSYAHTDETKEQMSVSALLAFKEGRRKVQGGAGIARPGKLNAVSRGVVQYDLQGNFVKEWESAKQAGEFLGVTNSGIISCCKGKGRSLTFKSFIWRYETPKEDELPNMKESVEETIFKIKNCKELVKQNMREQQKIRWNV